jgi:two-component system, chemotaxis family, CheB/CheR fusion protein
MIDDTTDEQAAAQTDTLDRHQLVVVGIGASAGGIKALSEFFSHMAADSGAAFVVILHLSPNHDSRLAEVLQRVTSMPVLQVHEATRIQPDHVYVIPPNQTLEVSGGMLRVLPPKTPEERHAPVDMFFRSLGDTYGAAAVAVILSGTGPNGSSGMKRIKERGGLALAQDPGEAEYAEMPHNSLATGLVDYVLPVAEMPRQIVAYQRRLAAAYDRISDPPAEPDTTTDSATLASVRTAQDWRDILAALRLRTGQDFSNYKPSTLRRRVQRRLDVRGLQRLPQYAALLRDDPEEPGLLMKEMLISVTSFFRDREAFAALERRVVPELLERHRDGSQLRVWSVGCATGEEAYSLAMLLTERAGPNARPNVQVFATDLDEAAVAQGREALYTPADVADVSPERLQRFFQREPRGYRVRRELRELVVFARHNVLRDPPFSHLDLVSCRNLLIYLNRTVQDRLMETFHFALRPGGFLFLGTSESVTDGTDLFVRIDKEGHIFESRTVTSRPSLLLPDRMSTALSSQLISEQKPSPDRISPGDLHLRLLEEYAAPSLVVNDEHVLLHASPAATRFLQVPPGEPVRDVLRLIAPELRPDLRTSLHVAAQKRSTVVVGGIRVNVNGDDRAEVLTLHVKPVLRDGDPPRGYFLVVLESADDVLAVAPAPETVLAHSVGGGEHPALENEVQRVKTQLRTTIEQYETHSEEARAANEELQAMNEELRSAAEELETSKEELQSVNEELTTVNQELKNKIDELGLTSNDFQNLIYSTDIATIFLDRSLRIKMSTPAAQNIFNLLPTDLGRPLSDITSTLIDGDFQASMHEVLEKLVIVEREVKTLDGRHFLMRIRPYRTVDDRIEGLSLTFHDISDWRLAELRVRGSEERLRILVDSIIDYAIFTMNDDGDIDSWNSGAERAFGYSEHEILSQPSAVLFTPEDRAAGVPDEELSTARRDGRADDERWHMRKDGTRIYCSGVMSRLTDPLKPGFVKIARDLTTQEQAALELERAHDQLEHRIAARTEQLRAEVTERTIAQDHVTNLLHRLVTAQEDERARIARDLHDQLGQQLTALRLALERHRETLTAQTEPDVHLDRALSLARQVDHEVDFLAWELRPAALDDLGLVAALPRFLAEWSGYHGIPSNFQTTGTVAGRLTPEAEITFYRVAQEALTNVVKHAHATRADVVLEGSDEAVVLIVEDDGVGFDMTSADAKTTGIGLVGMRERAALVGATLQVESALGEGTTVYLRLSLSGRT